MERGGGRGGAAPCRRCGAPPPWTRRSSPLKTRYHKARTTTTITTTITTHDEERQRDRVCERLCERASTPETRLGGEDNDSTNTYTTRRGREREECVCVRERGLSPDRMSVASEDQTRRGQQQHQRAIRRDRERGCARGCVRGCRCLRQDRASTMQAASPVARQKDSSGHKQRPDRQEQTRLLPHLTAQIPAANIKHTAMNTKQGPPVYDSRTASVSFIPLYIAPRPSPPPPSSLARRTWPPEMSQRGHGGQRASVDKVAAVVEYVHIAPQRPHLKTEKKKTRNKKNTRSTPLSSRRPVLVPAELCHLPVYCW